MKDREREVDMKLVWNAFRRAFVCLSYGFLAAAVTLCMGMCLPYGIATGIITLGGIVATILWKTSRRKHEDWYAVAADVGFMIFIGSAVFFLTGAYFGAGLWAVHGSFGGMIAGLFVIIVGIKGFPKPEA